jgi:Helicase associated domain
MMKNVLTRYRSKHAGNCNVPQSTSLGQWVKIQRENKREADLKAVGKLPTRTKPKPCLSADRVEKLNALNFQWRVAAPVTGWDNRYNQLLDYRKLHNGDVNVPQYYPADKAFGRWVMKQRSEYSLRLRGLKSQLTDERVEKLDSIGFSWVAPNFKRKIGVGIAPGSPAANVAAAGMQQNTDEIIHNNVPRLPPMDLHLLSETNNTEEVHHPAAVVPKPVADAVSHAQTTQAPAPNQQQHQEQEQLMQRPQAPPNPMPQHKQQYPAPMELQRQQQEQEQMQDPPSQQHPPPAPQIFHHQNQDPPPLDTASGFQAMHRDPQQHQLQHHQHMHHNIMNPHHDSDHLQTMQPLHQQQQQQQHDAAGDDIVNMEFL